MGCLCSDSVRWLQARIPAACAVNLNPPLPECRKRTQIRDLRYTICTSRICALRIDAACARILLGRPPNPSFYAWILFGLENGECLGSRAHSC